MEPIGDALSLALASWEAERTAEAPVVSLPEFPAAWSDEHLAVRAETDTECRGRSPRVVASPAAPWDRCPHCRGLGNRFEERGGYTYAVPCRCQDLRRWAEAVTRIGMPKAMLGATPDGWRPSPCWPALTSLQAYAAAWEPSAPGRLYLGANGIGKSWLMATVAWCLVARQLPRRIHVRWVSWTELLDRLRDGYAAKRAEAEVTGPLLTCDVLCVDELGHGQRTEWADMALERIVGRRLEDGGTTFATTNATAATLPALLGGRVFSRLTGRCELRELAGPHRREAPAVRGGMA